MGVINASNAGGLIGCMAKCENQVAKAAIAAGVRGRCGIGMQLRHCGVDAIIGWFAAGRMGG